MQPRKFASSYASASILSFAFFFSSAAQPEERKDYSEIYDNCIASSENATTAVVSGCAESVSDQAKSEMNRLYKRIYEEYHAEFPDDAIDLKKSQQSWLAYRNAHCNLAGRHIGSPMYYVCPMNLNIQRAKELRELLRSVTLRNDNS